MSIPYHIFKYKNKVFKNFSSMLAASKTFVTIELMELELFGCREHLHLCGRQNVLHVMGAENGLTDIIGMVNPVLLLERTQIFRLSGS